MLNRLDNKGRCCGRKPIEYKRYGGHHLFCHRCDREYNPLTGIQQANWAYDEEGNRRRQYPLREFPKY